MDFRNMDSSLLLQPYPNCTTNSKIRPFFFIPQILGFVPQPSIVKPQTIINLELCPC